MRITCRFTRMVVGTFALRYQRVRPAGELARAACRPRALTPARDGPLTEDFHRAHAWVSAWRGPPFVQAMEEQLLPELISTCGPERSMAKRSLLIGLSVLFFVLGVVFWLIPFASGIPFYLASIVFLGMGSRRCACWINTREQRLPYKHRVRLRKLMLRRKKAPVCPPPAS
jgi:hypothetical protein